MTDGPIRLTFRIDAFRPDTIPMSRLAAYMADLSAMIGEDASVHFVELKEGSAQLVHDVDYVAYPKIEARVFAVRAGTAPVVSLKAYQDINKKLVEDNTFATYSPLSGGAEIIEFPGARAPKTAQILPIEQSGMIDGQIVGVGGRQISSNVPVLVDTGDRIQACVATRGLAKELRNFFLEDVRRFYGNGAWIRETHGEWTLKTFTIVSHEQLDQRPLSAIVRELRTVPSGFESGADVWADIMSDRYKEGDMH